jgi:hypothetical protein
MGEWQELDDGRDTGILQRMIMDETEDVLVVKSTADVEPFLEQNKADMRASEEGSRGYTPSRDLQRVASIPNIIIEKWLKEEGINVFDENDTPKVLAKLDSPEYLYLRTAPGRLSRKPVREHPTTRSR